MSNTKNDTLGKIPKPQDPNNFMSNNNEPNIDINANLYEPDVDLNANLYEPDIDLNANLYEPDIDISADINTNTVANTNNTNINKYDIVIGTEKLFNLHGTGDYMTHKENSMGMPKLSKSVNTKTDKFRILLLTSPTAEIPGSTKAEGANIEEKTIGAHVAIQSYCGKYVSCGEESITHGCPSSFTSNINKEERFIMKYYSKNDTYVFESWNRHYLHYNETFHWIAFKRCKEKDTYGFPVKGNWRLLDTVVVNNEPEIDSKDADSSTVEKVVVTTVAVAEAASAVNDLVETVGAITSLFK
jgi:hypothetical protein